MVKILAILFFILFILASDSHAVYDPLSLPNNRFGMHVIDENDLEDTAKLVNANGDWGYVKLVITQNDRNIDKWQSIFDKMRNLHLIPIIRLATKVEGNHWIKPKSEDINNWVDFLNSLNWVIENRYVVIFNEPNHAKEWGGEINPSEYAGILKTFSVKLKEKSADFFILPAGLDASAPNSFETMDEVNFLKQMLNAEPDIFSRIDGWTSHSYPNPDFSGYPTAFGRGTVRTFLWEKELLKSFGVTELPIFITETGWKKYSTQDNDDANSQKISQSYSYAFQNVWNHAKVAVVTPFLLNYQEEPFLGFSWKKYKSDEYYPVYQEIQNLSKINGQPLQKLSANLIFKEYPQKLVTNSTYSLNLEIENTGQDIIDNKTGWQIRFIDLPDNFTSNIGNLEATQPFHLTRVAIILKTPKETGSVSYKLGLYKKDKLVADLSGRMVLIPPPSILAKVKLWLNRKPTGSDFKFIIYDNDKIVYEIPEIYFYQGTGVIKNLYNILPNREYRLVLIKPYYLPVQVTARLGEHQTSVNFNRLVPLDPSNDGAFNYADLAAFLKRPLQTIGLLVPL